MPLFMQIRRILFADVALSLLGDSLRRMSLDQNGLTVKGRIRRLVPYASISGRSFVKKGRFFASVRVPLTDGSVMQVRGVNSDKAYDFIGTLNANWKAAIEGLLEIQRDRIDTLSLAVARLATPRRYPSACLVDPFVAEARTLFETVPVTLPDVAIPDSQRGKLEAIAAFHRNPERLRDTAIAMFVEAEQHEMRNFFDTIEANPLTPEQRLAIVTDEDATLVLAGAGSGKTSVIVAKATYLIERRIRKPEEILLMAFGKDAAAEMAERIERRCGAPVAARTFHALAYGIIAEVEGKAPPLASHASDDAKFIAHLRDIVFAEVAKSSETARLLVRWFAEFFRPYRSEWDFKTQRDYYDYVKRHELRTLQGELVRSFEELEIANWLYLNGIAYEYEPIYQHPLGKTGRKDYTPDFRLTDSGVYIEHFGVRKERGADGVERLSTAPFVNREKYLAGMEWKRKVHAENGTVLVETYSYERVEGRLTEALHEKLLPFVKLEPLPPERVSERLREMGQVNSFTQTLCTFLRHFKGAALSVKECRKRIESFEDKERGLAFLTIFESIIAEYQARLGNRIDFENMILRATDHVRSGRYRSPFRHLLVDEFQDISKGRADLLRALKTQHEDARIFAVGDDWQSIYRFAGSDIHMMRNFGSQFGGNFAGQPGVHRTVDLGRTFRCVDRIALPAARFVLRNPSQIKKKVIPACTSNAPAIRIARTGKGKDTEVLQGLLEDLWQQAQDDCRKQTTSVLFLGRYRHSRPEDFSTLQKAHQGLTLGFKTIHASKGLEADHVIILNAYSGSYGLPSEIVDDPVLNLVLPEPELFEHAEERRVFYVALTRARQSVTILASSSRPSSFVTELLKLKGASVIHDRK